MKQRRSRPLQPNCGEEAERIANCVTPVERIHIIYTDRGDKCRQFSFVQRGRRLGL